MGGSRAKILSSIRRRGEVTLQDLDIGVSFHYPASVSSLRETEVQGFEIYKGLSVLSRNSAAINWD